MTPTLSAIELLAQSLLLTGSERKSELLMIVKVHNGFFDESGTDKSKDIISVGGWIGSYEKWAEFEHAWRAALPKEANGDFHYTEFWSRRKAKKPYWSVDWTENERIEFCKKLTRIALAHSSFGVGIVFSKTDYDKILPESHKRVFTDPSVYCFAHCLRHIMDWHKKFKAAPPPPLRMMCDRKSPDEAKEITFSYYKVKEMYDRDKILGDLSFGSRPSEPVLQAADLLVGELRRQREDKNSQVIPILQASKKIVVSFPYEDEIRAKVLEVIRSQEQRD